MKFRHLIRLVIVAMVIGGAALLDTSDAQAQFNPAPSCGINYFESQLNTIPTEMTVLSGTHNPTTGRITGDTVRVQLTFDHYVLWVTNQIDWLVTTNANVTFQLQVQGRTVFDETGDITGSPGILSSRPTYAEYGNNFTVTIRKNSAGGDPVQLDYLYIGVDQCTHGVNLDAPFNLYWCDLQPLTFSFSQSLGVNRYAGVGYGAPTLRSDTRQPVLEITPASGTTITSVSIGGGRALRLAGSSVSFTMEISIPSQFVAAVVYRIASNDTSVGFSGLHSSPEVPNVSFAGSFSVTGTPKNYFGDFRDHVNVMSMTWDADTPTGIAEFILDDVVLYTVDCVRDQFGLPLALQDFATPNEYFDSPLFDKIDIFANAYREHTPLGTPTTTTFALSNSASANVYAVTFGTVTAVMPVASIECAGAGITGIGDGCYFYAASGDWIGLDERQVETPLILQTWSNVNVSRVRVEYPIEVEGTFYIDYLVSDAIVAVDDEIERGDLLGKTIPLLPLGWETDEIEADAYTILPNHSDDWGFTAVQFDGDTSYNNLYPQIWLSMVAPPDPTTSAGDLGRPLWRDDEWSDVEMWDDDYVFSLRPNSPDSLFEGQVNVVTNRPNAPVYAVAGGEVSIRPLELNDCARPYFNFGTCLITLPLAIVFPAMDTDSSYKFELTDAYLVTVTLDANHSIDYIVYNADEYVTNGITIEAGCKIGETVRLLELLNVELDSLSGIIPNFSRITIGGNSYTRLRLVNTGSNEVEPLLERLGFYPDPNNPPCGADPAYSSCLTDGELHSPESWQTSGGVQWTNPGAILNSSGSRISVQVQLSSSTPYSLTVNARLLGSATPNSKIILRLGEERQEFTITGSALDSYVIPLDVYPADLGSVWTVSVENAAGSPIELSSVCVTDGEPNTEVPAGCYFNNSSFDAGVSGWTLSGDHIPADGGISVPNNSTISQDIDIIGDSDTIYSLQVDAALFTDEFYNASATDVTSSVTVEYQVNGGDWEYLFNTENGSNFAYFAIFAGVEGGIVTFETSFTPTANIEGTITFRFTIDSDDLATGFGTGAGVYGLRLHRICLTVPNDNSGDYLVCQRITPPTGNDLNDWTPWLWAKLNQFFSCDLMILLRQMYAVMQLTFELIGWMQRYSMAFLFLAVDWLSSAVLWANGHFANMGFVTVSTGGGANLWDFLIALVNSVVGPIISLITDLIRMAAVLLGALITGALGLTLFFIAELFRLIGAILGLVNGIISGIGNVSPVPIPGFPECGNNPAIPERDVICIGLWTLQETLFEPDGFGMVLMYLIIAVGSWNLIQWVIGQFEDLIERVGRNT